MLNTLRKWFPLGKICVKREYYPLQLKLKINNAHIKSLSSNSSNTKVSFIDQLKLNFLQRKQRTFSTSSCLLERSNYSPQFYFEMSSKHLSKGSKCPPLQEGMLRLYSMRFCPFAQRAILVALAKGIPHDVVNCHLKEKPEWLWERNPNGKVPVLEFPDGKILYESLIVTEYLDEYFQNRPLNSLDPFQKALDKIWVEEFKKVIRLFYKIMFAVRAEDTEALKENLSNLQVEVKRFEEELARRETTFFGGSNLPGFLDYMIWPWVERLPAVKSFISAEFYDLEELKREYPKLETWRRSMKEDFAVKEFFLPVEVHREFLSSFLNGSPNYDIIEAKL